MVAFLPIRSTMPLTDFAVTPEGEVYAIGIDVEVFRDRGRFLNVLLFKYKETENENNVDDKPISMQMLMRCEGDTAPMPIPTTIRYTIAI